jgi:glycosyltransferase 2 family protein
MIVQSMSKLAIAKMIVALVAFCGLLWFLDLQLIYQTAKKIDPLLIGCVFVLALVGLAIQTEKWHLLLSCTSPIVERSDALYSLLVGFGLGMFTPGRIGELGRGLVLAGDAGEIALLAAVDRLVSMAVTLLVGSAALLWLWTKDGGVVGMGFLLLVLALTLVARWALGISRRFAKGIRWRQWLAQISTRKWVCLALWSALFNAVFFVQFYVLVGGLFGWSLQVALAVPALFALKSLLPVSFLDIGVREGIAVWLYSHLGFDPLPAFNASLLVFVFNVLLPGVAGWILWGRRDTDRVFERGVRKVIP